MRTTSGDPSSEYFVPLAVGLLILVTLAFLAFLGGIWLFQPRVVPNHGMAAYKPPPKTHLIPLPHKMDAPELAELPTALTLAEPESVAKVVEKEPVAAKVKVARKRPKARPQINEYDRGLTYADGGHWGSAWGGRDAGGWGGGWNDRW